MELKPRCLATGIGSMPHSDVEKALDVVLANVEHAPMWPQLPSRAFEEQMEVQYSEGMPTRKLDEQNRRMSFETGGDNSEAFAEFYERYMAAMDPEDGSGDCSSMALSPEYSVGIFALEERLKRSGRKPAFVKCQTTGPCSFALTIVDENKRALYYNEEYRDMVVKALAMKCRWQIQRLAPLAGRVICFVDEPILSAFGSSTYVGVQRPDVVALLAEMVEAIHADGALAGIHCCGNTEWSILIDAGVDIVNFDAFGYGETIAMYPDHVRRHIEGGGVLAWGVIPTSTAIREKSVADLVAHYGALVDNLVAKTGLPKQLVMEQSIITPSCGTGSMEVADAERVFTTLREVSQALSAKC